MRIRTAWLALFVLASCDPNALKRPPPQTDSLRELLSVCAGSATLAGVDVSSYQGNIDWGSVASSGISFAYAKATEGTGYQDPTFPGNWSGMQAAGIARGAYHFFHPGVDGTQQADYYLAYVGSLTSDAMPPMLDWEVTDGVSGDTAAANAQAFISEIQAKTGLQTIVYTSPGLWSGFGVSQSFAADPLWVADYLYCTSGCCPELPSGWSSWIIWQWSDMGSVPGISGNVDLDLFNGNSAALQSLGGAACTYPLGHPVGGGGPISGGPCGGSAPQPAAPTACGSIPSGEGLNPGQSVESCDGRFDLIMQGDGNLVLYAHGEALWSSQTAGNAGASVVMQGDGNLVVYSSAGCALWDSGTAGNAGASLAVQNDANLVVYSGSTPLWSSGSGPIASPPTSGCGQIPSGAGLGPGDSITSCMGCFTLVMQTDGNLVMYQNGGHALWNSQTAGKGGVTAIMKTDGNLVVYSGGGCPLWESNTPNAPGSYLAVQDDGNLVIYGSGSTVEWDSAAIGCAGGCDCEPATTGTSSATAATTAATSTAASTAAAATTSTSGGSSGDPSTATTTSGGASSGDGTTGGSSGASMATVGSTGTTSRGEATASSGGTTGTHGSTATAGSSGSHASGAAGAGGSGAGSVGATLGGVVGSSASGTATGGDAPKGGCASAVGSANAAWFALLLVPASRRRRLAKQAA